MNCFCLSEYNKLGYYGTTVKFTDGLRHCLDWSFDMMAEKVSVPMIGFWIALMNLVAQFSFETVAQFKHGKDTSENF